MATIINPWPAIMAARRMNEDDNDSYFCSRSWDSDDYDEDEDECDIFEALAIGIGIVLVGMVLFSMMTMCLS